MRQLYVVSLSEDGRHVMLATSADATRGGFQVALDARLTAAVQGELATASDEVVSPVELTPREIQARVRSGESPEEVAAAHGLPVSRVARYAGPVLSELQGVITRARLASVARPGRGPSALSLGEAIDRQLVEAGVRPETVNWTARRQSDGEYVVMVRFVARGRARQASWRYDAAARALIGTDTASTDLGHVESTSIGDPFSRERAVRLTPPDKPLRRPASPDAEADTHDGSGDPAWLGETGRPPEPAQAGPVAAPPEIPMTGSVAMVDPYPDHDTVGLRVVPTPVDQQSPAAAAAVSAGNSRQLHPAATRDQATRDQATPDEATTDRTSFEQPTARPEADTAALAADAAALSVDAAALAADAAALSAEAAASSADVARPADGAAADPSPALPLAASPTEAPTVEAGPVDATTAVQPSPREPVRATARRRTGRASVPSWADVLLSTSPPDKSEDN